jgi:hypothetical protein
VRKSLAGSEPAAVAILQYRLYASGSASRRPPLGERSLGSGRYMSLVVRIEIANEPNRHSKTPAAL